MFSYISNLIGGQVGGETSSSSSYNETIAVDGTLIEYVSQSKNPKTMIMKAQLIIDKSTGKGRDIELIIKNKEFEKEKISFLLEESMEFSSVADQPDVIAYCWVNGNTVWVFKFSEKNYELSKCVSRLAYECIFENRNDRDFEKNDSYDDLVMESELPFDVDTLVMFKTTPSSPTLSSKSSPTPSSKTVESLPVLPVKETKPSSQPTQSTGSATVTPILYPSLVIGDEETRKKSYEKSINGKLEELCSAKCDLYLLDEKTHVYDLKRENITATIYEICDEEGSSNFEYVMDISVGDERLIIQDINSEMNVQFYNQFHSITWNFTNPFSSWSLIFKNLGEESEFKTNLSRSIYEFNTCSNFFKLSIEDQEMLVKTSATDQSMGDNSKYLRDLDYEDEDYVDFISDSEEEESEDEEDNVVPSGKQPGLPKYTNSFMLDSSQRERTFIIRGTDIGVFKRDDETDHPLFDTQIKNVSTPGGELFVPYKAMLHNQDRDLLFLHKDQEGDHCGKVYRMDITRGEVVETWNTFQDYVPVTEIKPTEKFGDQLPTQVFGALNDNAIFALDPRVHGSDKVVGNITAITSNSKPQYSCFATTLDGRLVVGSERGEIRMYSGIPNLDKIGKKGAHPKTAKTLLPGLGDAIIGIDVTSNGEWIVATCKTYLMVINTTMPEGDSTGFTERMGKKKPVPRKIQLLPEDVKQVGGSVSFKPAKFNSGMDGELWIVTSTGPHLITWNFKRITQNSLFDYTMKKVNNNENVVMSEFKSVKINEEGRHAPIIVTTPNDVLLEKKKKTSSVPYKKRITQYKK